MDRLEQRLHFCWGLGEFGIEALDAADGIAALGDAALQQDPLGGGADGFRPGFLGAGLLVDGGEDGDRRLWQIFGEVFFDLIPLGITGGGKSGEG